MVSVLRERWTSENGVCVTTWMSEKDVCVKRKFDE